MGDFEVRARAVRLARTPEPISGRFANLRFDPPLGGAVFESAVLEDVDFAGLHIDRFDASASSFNRCDFGRAVLRQASLGLPPRSIYRECRFDRADLRQCDPGLARFERCSFDGAKLDNWNCAMNDFVDCRFSGRLRRVVFSGGLHVDPSLAEGAPPRLKALMAPYPPNEFHGNDFRNADLDEVEFRGGIDLDAQLLPDDPAYVRLDIRPEILARVEAYVVTLEGAERTEAQSLLDWLRGWYRNQPVVFTRSFGKHTFGLYRELLRHVHDN